MEPVADIIGQLLEDAPADAADGESASKFRPAAILLAWMEADPGEDVGKREPVHRDACRILDEPPPRGSKEAGDVHPRRASAAAGDDLLLIDHESDPIAESACRTEFDAGPAVAAGSLEA
jgi:hypothetical protein